MSTELLYFVNLCKVTDSVTEYKRSRSLERKLCIIKQLEECFNENKSLNEINRLHDYCILTLWNFRSPFSTGSSTSEQGQNPGNGVRGLIFGLQEPEKAPIKLLILRREEMTCGGRLGSIRRSDTILRASFSTERSTPFPLPEFQKTKRKILYLIHIKFNIKKSTLI